MTQDFPAAADLLAVVARSAAADTLRAALDAVDHGVLVCGAQGQLLLLNRAARQELAGGGVLAVGAGGVIDLVDGAGLPALRGAIHGAAWLGSHHLLPLQAAHRTLMLSVQPLAGGEAPRVLLMSGRRSLCPELAVRQLGRVYALTAAEMEVLGRLLAGARTGDLAEARGVKVSTVRTQLTSLRIKLGVQRLDDITRLVAELPPMQGVLGAPPVRPESSRPPAGAAAATQPGA